MVIILTKLAVFRDASAICAELNTYEWRVEIAMTIIATTIMMVNQAGFVYLQ